MTSTAAFSAVAIPSGMIPTPWAVVAAGLAALVVLLVWPAPAGGRRADGRHGGGCRDGCGDGRTRRRSVGGCSAAGCSGWR